MPVTPKPLASAMMVPTRQVTIPTSAGRSVRFVSGIATINDTNDLPYLMARDDVKLMITSYAMSWIPDVLSKTHKINADVHWPDGYAVERQDDGVFDIICPDPPQVDDSPVDSGGPLAEDQSPQQGDDKPAAAVLDEALKGKPGWRKPRAS